MPRCQLGSYGARAWLQYWMQFGLDTRWTLPKFITTQSKETRCYNQVDLRGPGCLVMVWQPSEPRLSPRHWEAGRRAKVPARTCYWVRDPLDHTISSQDDHRYFQGVSTLGYVCSRYGHLAVTNMTLPATRQSPVSSISTVRWLIGGCLHKKWPASSFSSLPPSLTPTSSPSRP